MQLSTAAIGWVVLFVFFLMSKSSSLYQHSLQQHSTHEQSASRDQLAPVPVDDPVVWEYFTTLSDQDFAETANLFADDGILYAPFSEQAQGPEAIADYLNREAKGMRIHPVRCTINSLEDGDRLVDVVGKVETVLFWVNVGWQFHINEQSKISSVRVKLLASLEELLNLKHKSTSLQPDPQAD